jgi:hypothetical protein
LIAQYFRGNLWPNTRPADSFAGGGRPAFWLLFVLPLRFPSLQDLVFELCEMRRCPGARNIWIPKKSVEKTGLERARER